MMWPEAEELEQRVEGFCDWSLWRDSNLLVTEVPSLVKSEQYYCGCCALNYEFPGGRFTVTTTQCERERERIVTIYREMFLL